MGVGIIPQGCKIRARVAIKYSTQHRSGHVQNTVRTFALSVFSNVILVLKKIWKSWHFLSKGYDQKLIREKALTFGNVRRLE